MNSQPIRGRITAATDITPLAPDAEAKLRSFITGPLGTSTVVDHTTVLSLLAELDRIRAEFAPPASRGHGTSTTRALTSLAALVLDSSQRRCTAYGIALDVDAAGMLLSPELAAEMDRVRSERDRYRSAWQSARDRAQAHGEGILRVVSDRESYQLWLRQAEDRVAELRTDNEALTKQGAELETTPTKVYSASNESIPIGLFSTPEKARARCQQLLLDEYPAHYTIIHRWVSDDEDDPSAPSELVAESYGTSTRPTGYVVTPLDVDADDEWDTERAATPAPASTPQQSAPDDCETPHRFSARDGWRMVCGSCDHTQGATCHSTVTAPAATG